MKMRHAMVAMVIVLTSLSVRAQVERPAAGAGVHQYACPMKCEGAKAYTAEGKCPVCGAGNSLVESGAEPAAPFSLSLVSPDGPPKGNEETTFRAKVVDSAGDPVPDLKPIDGKKLHLYVVLRDLAWFAHLTPEEQSAGTFEFKATMPPGEFAVFAVFAPALGSEQVVATGLSVLGKPANPRALGADADRPRMVDGRTVTLDGFQSAAAGVETSLTFRIAGDADANEADQTYLGKPADVVVIGQDLKHLFRPVLVPSSTRGANLVYSATFPDAGLYRVWIQFQRAGKVSTAAFNVQIAPKP